eukprot:TRINITY_DN13294_c0_g1_i1.p1 TRINITY_DN13294_c0_g1~~TRINITY_DN13294_c0_g1_i1.p1  ORF type:complete len:102 (+),score=12.03 TRINITY_DN13294_c0_g1_i1:38-307(+)
MKHAENEDEEDQDLVDCNGLYSKFNMMKVKIIMYKCNLYLYNIIPNEISNALYALFDDQRFLMDYEILTGTLKLMTDRNERNATKYYMN